MADWLPSLPTMAVAAGVEVEDLARLAAGQRLGDFVIQRVLGRGGFAAVYLAQQLSLDRQVALKVVLPSGQTLPGREGQSLAQLEHPHIVQVYLESRDPASGAQLLCMQYVPGTTLAEVIDGLRLQVAPWTGGDLIAVLDRLDLPPARFEPDALVDRQFLIQADHLQAVCRIGSQLASALHHAHRRGVLHRDIKPSNVLISRFGQPLLADFNLAARHGVDSHSEPFGGTIAYMAPEHLDAFNREAPTPTVAVDQRSDIYSLGVLLWKLATGATPFPGLSGSIPPEKLSEELHRLARHRRTQPTSPVSEDPRLVAVLLRCLAPDPEDRFQQARDLQRALEGLAQQQSAQRAMPAEDFWSRVAWHRPVLWLFIAGLAPQLVASLLQVSYNATRVLGELSEPQHDAFMQLVIVLNPILYGICLLWIGRRLIRVLPTWQRIRAGDIQLTDREVSRARRRALQLPWHVATVAGVGWAAGAVLFPLGLDMLAGGMTGEIYMHFAISFLLAGLIAATYSYFAVATVVVRAMYVRFWHNPREFRRRAARELSAIDRRIDHVTLLAGIIPLIGAAALVIVGPEDVRGADYAAFRFLATGLILAGGLGFFAVGRTVQKVHAAIDACRGRGHR